ncbi:MAG: hypothetical protein IH944_01535 [Armatimonadetes bacterium]|nr:hypothetical protein [Armatimonadota bacterium]
MDKKIGAWCGVVALALCVGCSREKVVWTPADPDWLDQSEVVSEVSVTFFESSQGAELAVYDLPPGESDEDDALDRLMRWAEYHGVATVSSDGTWNIAFDVERRKIVGFHGDEQIVWFHANLPSDDWRSELRDAPLPEIKAAIELSRSLAAHADPLRLIHLDEDAVAPLGTDWYTFGEVLGGPPGMYTGSVIDASDRTLYDFASYQKDDVDSVLSRRELEQVGDWFGDVRMLKRTSTGEIAGILHKTESAFWSIVSKTSGEEFTDAQIERISSFALLVFGSEVDQGRGEETEPVSQGTQ